MKNIQRKAAKEFAVYWKDKGYEKGESQKFWLSLLRDVFGMEKPEQHIEFEEKVKLEHTNFIDAYIPEAKILIEQKGRDVNLWKANKQSDGSVLTPYQQAKRYIIELPVSKHPRWVITCNFKEFHIYNMEKPGGDPIVVKLENLEKEYYLLQILAYKENIVLKKEMDLSIAAGDIVGLLYNALAKQYKNPENAHSMKSLNVLCVRFVFCLYAEDAGVFKRHGQFHDYLMNFSARETRKAVIELFKILDQKPEDRDPYLKDDNPILAEFRYVNGGLFENEDIEIPPFTDEIRNLLLINASENFDWSKISPTIFGAVFESTLNPDTRRKGGMHYTSIENIHKVIDPLFLDELKAELDSILSLATDRLKKQKLQTFQKKLSSLVFLDPAAGSGNFLTESYICLRKLENQILKELQGNQVSLGFSNYSPIQVSISQFYGIEINDFAVTVAKAALWIAESQMMEETEGIVHMNLNFLPLKTNAYIVEANSLRIDWNNIIDKTRLSYILGNPPFVGRRYRSPEQTKDVAKFFTYKDIDYVACWYKKAADYIQNTHIKCALVSTNSITQGEQVTALWKELMQNYNICIDFAHKTFRWDSEASLKAHVHCVIVGFSVKDSLVKEQKKLYDGINYFLVDNINGYLMDGPNIFLENHSSPICDVPKMKNGNVPLDGDALKIEKEDLPKFKNCMQYVKRLIGGRELLHGEERYVLWLVGASPAEIKKYPQIYKRVEQCRQNRLNMKDKGTQKLADTPATFRDTNNPDKYIALPMVSSERRRYIPMDYLDGNVIPTNQVQTIPEASLYHFGVLNSNVHMCWMRAVCGRLKSDFRYSKDIVYNNFPWPTPTPEQKRKIEETAQGILNARATYPDSCLSDLYDDNIMPADLRIAHNYNNIAVLEAYGFTKSSPAFRSESACVAELMKMYQKIVSK